MERAASALKWWVDAGVDTLIAEEPRRWLTPTSPAEASQPTAFHERAPEPEPEPAKVLPGTGSGTAARSDVVEVARANAITKPAEPSPPPNLPDFLTWLATADLGPGLPGPRLLPSGDPAASLMVLVDMPSAADEAAGRLLAGDAGALFDRMLTAIGHHRDSIWLASICPARSAGGRLDPDRIGHLAGIARHHAGIVGPRALLLFGDACSRALLGAPVAGARGKWHELSTPAGPVRTLVTIRPEKLLAQPALKKLAWDDLQKLKEEPVA